MNKTYLIVGGASVASLAAGATGGYLFAKKKFNEQVDELIALEVEKTKKYFSVLLMQAKPASPLDIPIDDTDEELADEELADEDSEEEELTEADKKAIAKGGKVLREASAALINYKGYADKPALAQLVSSNIFSPDGSKKPHLPPRGPGGKFVPVSSQHDDEEDDDTSQPYLITQEEYLQGDMDYEQKQLRYFIRADTLIDPENNDEAVDNDVVGEDNLKLFPQVPKDELSMICVRNDGLKIDYEIQLTHESLTEHMGLGEEDEEADSDEYDYSLQD